MSDDASKWAALFAATAAQHMAIYAPHIVAAGSKEEIEAAVHATLEAMPAVTDADLSKVYATPHPIRNTTSPASKYPPLPTKPPIAPRSQPFPKCLLPPPTRPLSPN
eukprot:3562334-Pleurochrysis_carterae.AAC.1